MSGSSYSASSSSGPHWKAPSPSALQQELQGYEVLELIGQGGMGAVYKARQNSLDRLVAIKVLPSGLWEDEAEYAQRFRNEARLMARLMHPGMIAVFDFGEMPGGLLYIVMEFVEGTDVSKMLLQKGQLEPVHAISIAAHVCDTLSYAHEHGIVHRDIKPANVMVDMEGRVKVADFGLAKHSTQDGDEAHSTMTMGTPDYVAPESLQMGVVADGRADLYSLGVMLYEMLTGDVPRGLPPAPSEVVPGLDKRLDAIVKRAMQHEPGARYQKAADFRKDLNHILTVPVAKAQGPRPAPFRASAEQAAAAAARTKPKSSSLPGGVVTVGMIVAGAVGFYVLNGKNDGGSTSGGTDKPPTAAHSAAAAEGPNPSAVAPASPDGAPAPGTTPDATPAPASAPVPPEIAQRLTELETQFKSAVQRDVTQVKEAALRDLNSKFLAALDRAMINAAAGTATPQEIAALNGEKARVSLNQPLPAEDGPEVTSGVKDLRRIYRTTLGQIETEAAKTQRTLSQKYDGVLAAYEQELAQPGQEAGAGEVRRRRGIVQASLGQSESSAAPAPALANAAPAMPDAAAPATPAPVTPTLGGEEGKLQQYLSDTVWRWRSQSDEAIELHAGGKVVCPSWDEQNLGVQWQVLGRRHVLLKATGRSNNTEAHLHFAEDLATYSGTDFSGRPFRVNGSRIPVVQATQAFLDREERMIGRITFPAGDYRPKKHLILGGPDPVDPKAKTAGRFFTLPGARITGGSAFIERGAWTATGTLFTNMKITAEWGADFKATNSLFSNCRLGKGGDWFGDYFSSKWTFDNCVFAGSFIQPWKVIDIGIKLNQCTFHEIDFAPLIYQKDAGDEVKRSWLSIENCRFVNCRIPESVLIATKNCVFESCNFGAPESELRIKTPVKTTVYLTDRRSAPITGPDRQIEILDASRIPQPAGASLRYGRNGLTLSFQ